jgi:hypothetical protein
MLKKKVSIVVTLTDAFKTLQNRNVLSVPWMDQRVSTRGNSRILYIGFAYYLEVGQRNPKTFNMMTGFNHVRQTSIIGGHNEFDRIK